MDTSKNTIDERGYIRFDFLFSYWVYIWFLMFYFIDKTTIYGKAFQKYGNPKLALSIALFENIFTLFWIIFANGRIKTIIKYSCMMLIVKVLPLYLVYKTPIQWPQDLYVFTGVFVLYIIYLYLNDESLMTIYKRTFTSIMNRDNNTTLFHLVAYLGDIFHIDKRTLAWS